jgi:hypothetical protein
VGAGGLGSDVSGTGVEVTPDRGLVGGIVGVLSAGSVGGALGAEEGLGSDVTGTSVGVRIVVGLMEGMVEVVAAGSVEGAVVAKDGMGSDVVTRTGVGVVAGGEFIGGIAGVSVDAKGSVVGLPVALGGGLGSVVARKFGMLNPTLRLSNSSSPNNIP